VLFGYPVGRHQYTITIPGLSRYGDREAGHFGLRVFSGIYWVINFMIKHEAPSVFEELIVGDDRAMHVRQLLSSVTYSIFSFQFVCGRLDPQRCSKLNRIL
jgi:hypothetical protein